jgi:hypothetical protein
MGEVQEAFERARYELPVIFSTCLKTLLEDKHLYQYVSVGDSEQFKSILQQKFIIDASKETFTSILYTFLEQRLALGERQQFSSNIPILCLIIGNVKLFCSECEQREAFRPVMFSAITKELNALAQPNNNLRISFRSSFQLFYIVYQCQICGGKPNIVLIKRDGFVLSIEGRFPIEHLELPKFIPKEEKKWFRDALIAFQTGKVLAALFYLRTFIEQFARRKTGKKEEKMTGDDILSAYADTLPVHLRDTMPSLRDCYDKLSAAVHGAKEDATLFETMREKVEDHFDIRRVHKLDANELKPEPKSEKK